MAKPFFDVFPSLQLDTSIRQVMEQTHVEKIIATKRKDLLRVYLLSTGLICKDHIWSAERAIKKQLFSTANIVIKIYERFELSTRYSAEDLMEVYRDSILAELKEYNHIAYRAFKEAQIIYLEEGCIILTLEDNILVRNKEGELVRILEKILVERCGFPVTIQVQYKEAAPKKNEEEEAKAHLAGSYRPDRGNSEEYSQEGGSSNRAGYSQGENTSHEKSTSSMISAVPETRISHKSISQGKEIKKAQKKEPKGKGRGFTRGIKRSDHPDVIYGRDFDEEAMLIEDIIGEIGEVVIRGKVRGILKREITNAKTMIAFDLTDFTDTISVKMFVLNEHLDELLKGIHMGAFLKVKGICMMDKFDREILISSLTGIKKIQDFTTTRMDTSPEKRVELHCHTKMSDMDGVSEVKDLVKRAYQWGHKAIAITDHGVVHGFTDANKVWEGLWRDEKGKRKEAGEEEPDKDAFFKVIYGVEAYIVDDIRESKPLKKLPSYHAILLAKNDLGRINLYRLVSMSHLEYFYKRPRIPKSQILKYRDGLILGSACEAGELYHALLKEKPEEEVAELVNFYDYLEIQPIGNNRFMINSDKIPNIQSEEDIRNINRRIVELGEQCGKPVVAACDVHFLDPEDEVYRRIIMAGKQFSDADNQAPLYLHTTEEMLWEFSYLGSEKAKEVVITNTNRIADMIECISPVRPDRCPPYIPHSDKLLTEICYKRANEIYGPELPTTVKDRLERELNSIITNDFAVMYIIAQKLVWKSVEDGYLVGSRGSVGSSFVATLAGITEVNPLNPHYYCPQCYYNDFTSEEVQRFSGGSGIDMPNKECPDCGTLLKKDGFDIPFETFLGFKGDKEPDIDLNFSGEYQSRAHKYTEQLFGTGQTYRAGTIGTLADKTAFGYVKNYYEERNIHKRSKEISRIVEGCTGVRKSTGQHPGGIVVLPTGEDINSFTPVQHPANDMTTDVVTTHFDYHSIDHNLLKLDILGHDDPTMIRMLQDLTGIDPLTIPMDDPKVMSLFRSTDALGITPEQIGGCPLGSMGIPEFGTEFVIKMLIDTEPGTFSDLIRISGLSHGTDVWLGNAQKLIEDGNATISTAICTRDDIMTYLIHMGVESSLAFVIMESVRKGKGLKDDWIKAMKEKDVPDWYIWSCQKISYMFPKAHAAAYVMMAWRIAYCKVYHPLAYYAAYFSIRAKAFSYEVMCQGRERLDESLADYKRRADTLTNKEKDALGDMKIVQEMYARGFEFIPIDIYTAKASIFQIFEGKLMPSLNSIEGLGEKAADAIVEAVKNGPFLSKEDFRLRTKTTKTVVELMDQMNLLGNLPETNQMSLFDFAN